MTATMKNNSLNNASITINEEHLGPQATVADAHRMVELLRDLGYQVDYTPERGTGRAELIPDAAWFKCLARMD